MSDTPTSSADQALPPWDPPYDRVHVWYGVHDDTGYLLTQAARASPAQRELDLAPPAPQRDKPASTHDPSSALKLTAAQIDAARTPKGAWTRATLARWGVPWPPPKGWRKALLAGHPIPQ